MTEIDTRWAWSRVEAMADRSLEPADEGRMRAAMQRDPRLGEAVEHARGLQRTLRRLGEEPVPASLQARLMQIAEPQRKRARLYAPLSSWASAAAAASTVAALLLVLTQPQLPVRDEGTAALREFEVAMAYLQKSYEIAGDQVRRAMTRELRETLGINGDGDARRDGNGG